LWSEHLAAGFVSRWAGLVVASVGAVTQHLESLIDMTMRDQ
jgi:hypothetical protein